MSLASQRYEAAYEDLSLCVALEPAVGALYLARGDVLERMERFPEARVFFVCILVFCGCFLEAPFSPSLSLSLSLVPTAARSATESRNKNQP